MKKLIFLIPIFFWTSLYSQNMNSIHKADCDSVFADFNLKFGNISIKEMPKLIKPFDEFQNYFLDLIDTNKFNKNIYLKAFIDTNGNVLCLDLIVGNNNEIDSIAMDYLLNMKFNPAINVKGRKIPAFISIPFYGNKLKETYTLIKIKNKWLLKNNSK